MTKIGTEGMIYDLRRKIQQVQTDLNQLGDPVSEIPELITSANLLRSNEYLFKANEKKTELLSTYEQYFVTLEKLLSSVFDMQHDLKEILREQSSMIFAQTKKKSKAKTKLQINKK
ncbi:MAG: hypothetical protein IIA82_02495 [Thaumarchaeota archaeon]|nr:hypothetical protein [Nitrososphaerota archaeon]